MVEVHKSSPSSDTTRRAPQDHPKKKEEKKRKKKEDYNPPELNTLKKPQFRDEEFFPLQRLVDILPAEISPPQLPRKLVTDKVGHTNTWTLPQDLVESLTKAEWPKDVTFKWDTKRYPTDFDSSNPDETRSIFKRKFFLQAEIFNPPYDPQTGDPRDTNIMSLRHHVPHLIQCARRGRVPMLIVLPDRTNKVWYKWAANQEDIAVISLANNIPYLRGVNQEKAGNAPFKTIILLRAKARNILIQNNGGKISFPKEWLNSITWCEETPAIVIPRTTYKFVNWDKFLNEALDRTRKRKAITPSLDFHVPEVQTDVTDLTKPSNKTPLQAFLQHVELEESIKTRTVSTKELNQIRANSSKLPSPGRCAHCNQSDQATEEYFHHLPEDFFHLKSEPLQLLVKRIMRKRTKVRAKIPKRRDKVTLGQHLMGPVLQEMRNQAQANRRDDHEDVLVA